MLGLRASPHDGAVMEPESPIFVCVVEVGVTSEDGRAGETYSTSRLDWAACANVREINPRYTTPAAKTPTTVVPDEWQAFCHSPFMRVTCIQLNAGHRMAQGGHIKTALDDGNGESSAEKSAAVTG